MSMTMWPYLFASCFFCSLFSRASVDVSQTEPIAIPEQTVNNATTSKDIQEVVPTDMHRTNDPNYVASKMGDRALQNFLNSPQVKNSSFGKTADTMQNAMKTEVKTAPTTPGGVEHKFAFQLNALQQTSEIKYTGWINASMNFDARANESVFQVTEKIFDNKDLTLSHKNNPVQQGVSSLGVKWSF